MSVQQRRPAMSVAEMSNRWPHIWCYLLPKGPVGWVGDYLRFCRVEDRLNPVELAATYEEWADFYEWCLVQRTEELAADRVKRHLVAEWTESMAYSCRRSAAFARGEDPGEWIPLSVRCPDMDAERRVLTAEIIADLKSRDEASAQLPVSG